MRAVNLLPRDSGQRQLKKESLPVLVGGCSGLLVVALLGAMFMMGSGKIAAQQRKVDDLNRQYQALPPAPAGPSAAQQQLAGEQSARVSALSTALSTRTSWDRVFREFSLVLPDDVWLTTLSAKSPISPLTNALDDRRRAVPVHGHRPHLFARRSCATAFAPSGRSRSDQRPAPQLVAFDGGRT